MGLLWEVYNCPVTGRWLPPACIVLPCQPLANPPHRLLQRLQVRSVGEAEIALAIRAEAGTGDGGDARLVEEAVLQRATLGAGASDIGEGVDGAAWCGATETGQAVERFDDV